MKKIDKKSKCCEAPVEVQGEGYTKHHVCSECAKPCRIVLEKHRTCKHSHKYDFSCGDCIEKTIERRKSKHRNCIGKVVESILNKHSFPSDHPKEGIDFEAAYRDFERLEEALLSHKYDSEEFFEYVNKKII